MLVIQPLRGRSGCCLSQGLLLLTLGFAIILFGERNEKSGTSIAASGFTCRHAAVNVGTAVFGMEELETGEVPPVRFELTQGSKSRIEQSVLGDSQ